MLIRAHAPVFAGRPYREGDKSGGGPTDCHMVTSPFCKRGDDLPEWILLRLALKRLSCLCSGQIVVTHNQTYDQHLRFWCCVTLHLIPQQLQYALSHWDPKRMVTRNSTQDPSDNVDGRLRGTT